MSTQSTSIQDLVTTTLNNVEPLKFTDISSDLNRMLALNQVMKKHKVIFDTGVDFRWDLMTDNNHSARAVPLYYEVKIGVPDVMAQGVVPWRHVTWNWGIERREIAMNRSPRKIVDIALTRRLASFVAAAELMETIMWSAPAVTDDVTPWGIPVWVVKAATVGFTSNVPAGWTTVGNLNPSSNPRWENYAFPYTLPTADDLMQKWYNAAELTDFDTAVPDMPTFNTGNDMGFYTNKGLLFPLKQIMRTSNDDLGSDLENFGGKTLLFQGKPVMRVPKLDLDTTNPIYGINWGEMKIAGLRGEWLYETKIPILPNQPTVSFNNVDLTCQFFTRNRRRHFVGSTGTTMPF